MTLDRDTPVQLLGELAAQPFDDMPDGAGNRTLFVKARVCGNGSIPDQVALSTTKAGNCLKSGGRAVLFEVKSVVVVES